ncbi:hypothetical protein [Leptospira sp. id769339]|uniref:LIC_13246 family protein n=1 Tax=Leptospira sp. id769339 TaxID=2864221 RepID=UPI00214B4EFD|nr:hypothetical protein [Leptospira sp. id769339]
MTQIQNKKHEWLQINSEGIEIFNKILRSLIAFYRLAQGSSNTSNEAWKFKVRLVESDNTIVCLKRFGDYEYFIFGKILGSNKEDYNSWIHIDGIQIERTKLQSDGITKHEAFEILSMTDIYLKYCEPYSGEIPEDI